MTYKIARDGQQYGPYSLTELQQYTGTGNVLLTDLALAEGATEWVSVASLMGTMAPPPATPGMYGGSQIAPAASIPASAYPPPDLNWGIVLLLNIVTCGIFAIAWNLVQALWMKRVQPETKALVYYIAVIALAIINIGFSAARMMVVFNAHGAPQTVFTPMLLISGTFTLISLIMQWIVYPFEMRRSLLLYFNQTDPVGLRLSGVMTFFFGSLYFQYHLNRINEMRRGYQAVRPY